MKGFRTSVVVPCAHPGCHEFTTRLFSSRRAARAMSAEWRCEPHKDLARTLSAGNPRIATELEVVSGARFRVDGEEIVGGFYVFGPGFRAWARDFPAGTKISILATATIPTGGVE